MKIIGLGHRRRVGKDAAANFLATHFKLNYAGQSVLKTGFAVKLKDIAHQLYAWAGLQNGEYYDQYPQQREIILPRLGKTPRTIWIELGNNIRQIWEDTWLDYLLLGKNVDLLIIYDLRYLNEAQAIKDRDGIILRIDRDDVPKATDIADSALANYTDWDGVIHNNGTLHDLHFNIISMTERYLNG